MRGRFLLGYGYLVVLPLLAVEFLAVRSWASPDPRSWWASAWPFLILSGVFFVLEVVTLVASSGERQTLPAVKDAVFVVALCGIADRRGEIGVSEGRMFELDSSDPLAVAGATCSS